MGNDFVLPDAKDSNLYLKIGGQLLGPVTRHEALQLHKQEIVLKNDMVAMEKEGPWVEIGESNFNLEMLFPSLDATPLPTPGVLSKEVVKAPLPKEIHPLPPASPPSSAQLYIAPPWLGRRSHPPNPPVSGPLSYPEIKNKIPPRPLPPVASNGIARSLLFAVILIAFLVGISIFAISLLIKFIDSRNYSFPNKNYPEKWKEFVHILPDLSADYFKSIDVWSCNSVFISTYIKIHRWDGNGWKSLRLIQDDWDLSKITAIGPNHAIAVRIKDNNANWIICNPPNDPPQSFFFKGDNLKPYELRDTKPLIGKNGEYIFPASDDLCYYKEKEPGDKERGGNETHFKKGEEAEMLMINVRDPLFAKFVMEETNRHGDFHRLFLDEKLRICAFSKGTTVLIIEEKDRNKAKYELVGISGDAWKGWARSPTTFWIMSRDGMVLKIERGQMKKITQPLLDSNKFNDACLDKNTGAVYGITDRQIWLLDE